MSIEAINEALELLRITQSGMGHDPGYLDRYDWHHWDRISKCREGLEKLKQQEPVAFTILSDSGNAVRIWWRGAERERAERIAARDFPGMPLLALYAAPVPAVVPDGVVEALQRLIENGAVLGPASEEDALLVARWRKYLLSAAPAAPSVPEQTMAAADVLAERRRQVESEGWTPEHDDQHSNGELAAAASCYAFFAANPDPDEADRAPFGWPWSEEWWKPTDTRCDLVKAGALILAEIERLDRAAAVPTSIEQLQAIAKAGELMRERCAEKIESQHAWITSAAASALIRALPGVKLEDLK